MLLSDRSFILLLCNLYNNDIFPCINSNQRVYKVDQLFDILRGLDLLERHRDSACDWCVSDIFQAWKGRWALGFGDEQEIDVCRAGGCSGTLPTCANNPYAASLLLCYSSCMVSDNVETRLVLPQGGGHRTEGIWRAKRAASLPLFPNNLSD